jgi:coproporphyrinogen III oxidase
MALKEQFISHIHDLQDKICSGLERLDAKAVFIEDKWERAEGGGGRTRVISDGSVFEKGGVNISMVHGALPPAMQELFKVQDSDFFACGLSLVIHPRNPFVPTVHANWRYFELYDKAGKRLDCWFGGGSDLTPYYIFEEDGKQFTNSRKEKGYPLYRKGN